MHAPSSYDVAAGEPIPFLRTQNLVTELQNSAKPQFKQTRSLWEDPHEELVCLSKPLARENEWRFLR